MRGCAAVLAALIAFLGLDGVTLAQTANGAASSQISQTGPDGSPPTGSNPVNAPSQNQASQNQASQNQASQNQASQNQASQNQASQNQASPNPPNLSPSCEAPAADIAANGPLPHLAKAMVEHRPLQILAIGSSTSAGLGINSGVKSYPVQLEDMLKDALKGNSVDIINRGTGGEVAQTASDRIRTEVAMVKPDLVLWQLGTNDALARVDPGQFTDIVRSTIAWLKDNDIDVVLVGLQYTTRFAKDESYFAIREALGKIAKEDNILYVKRYDAMKFIAQTKAKVHLMASDNYHLSDLGTQCMAEHVARAMIANLFVRRFRPNPGPVPTVQ